MQVNHIGVGHRLLPLSFQCQAGEKVYLVGPNGSGKSTLLSALSGVLSRRDGGQGEVQLDTVSLLTLPLTEQARFRAYLSQQAKPAFHIDVYQMLALSLPAGCKPSDSHVKQAVAQLSALLQLEDKLHRRVQTLSGGEWQRVRLAAVCLQVWRELNPFSQLLLLDEPAAPLDVAQEKWLYQLIDVIAAQGITVVVANHDLNRVCQHADKVLLLNQGVMEAYGTPEQVMTVEHLQKVFRTSVKKVMVDDNPYLIFT
ncbi:vitamin B12 ABC transporter ATP-binding protein BtuD [Vibrio navarrensis]|uniref:vitamin B12 ABC transporter ATP-binding protein BtuD n=1 Tax=Vibrio navarrensis TaxID=29495 RepID=UPI001558F386|nr:vitamin B12 ABC transporter ATP-binding protein BtuD [Vibrio navarrensis]